MIWRLEYCNKFGDTGRLDIQRGSATPVEIVEGTDTPFMLSYELEDNSKKGYIMSSFADISIFETPTFNIDELKTSNETELSVKWYINSVLKWSGYVVPDFFSRDIGSPAIINMSASDRLSSLKNATISITDEYVTLSSVLEQCLVKTGLSLTISSTVDFTTEGVNVLDVYAVAERLKDLKGNSISCYGILRSILVLTNSTIRQREGGWTIYNKIQHELLPSSVTFDEVHKGAKREIQPVIASVGAFQEFGGARLYPPNHSFANDGASWNSSTTPAFATEFDSRNIEFQTETGPAIFGGATDQNQLINRNLFNQSATSIGQTASLSSSYFEVPFDDFARNIDFKLEINTRSVSGSTAYFAITYEASGFLRYLTQNGEWVSNFEVIEIEYAGYRGAWTVDDITTIEGVLLPNRLASNPPETLTVYILGVSRPLAPSARIVAIRSVKAIFPDTADKGKGILYKTEQIGNFSKRSDPETTIFGDYIRSGLNGYFYRYRRDERTILHRLDAGEYIPTSSWTTATDPAAGELPLLQHVSRQTSRMFGVAHDILSAVLDAQDFDPLDVFENCSGEKYVVVSSSFDFLRSTIEVELEQIAYGILDRRDFIYSYFGDTEKDGVGSISGISDSGGASSTSSGSFLDRFFEIVNNGTDNEYLRANVSIASMKELMAWAEDPNMPASLWDSMPYATPTTVGGVKVGANLSIDPVTGVLSADGGGTGTGFDATLDYNPSGDWNFSGVVTLSGSAVATQGWSATQFLATALKGANNGLAELDAQGRVPAAQLPSYVDDVLEYPLVSNFPTTGESGKIYVASTSNLTYRWTGTAYVEISKSLALGETSATAYRGDRGATAYTHSQASGNPHGTTFAQLASKPTTLAGFGITDAVSSTGTAYNSSRLGGVLAADYLRRNVIESVSRSWTFETNDGLVNISPTGWRVAARASLNIRSKTDNPAELNLTHAEGADLRGWQLSGRGTAQNGELHLYSHTNAAYGLQLTINKDGDITPSGHYRLSDKWSIGFNGTNNDLEFFGSDGAKKAMIDQSGNLYSTGEVTAFSTR